MGHNESSRSSGLSLISLRAPTGGISYQQVMRRSRYQKTAQTCAFLTTRMHSSEVPWMSLGDNQSNASKEQQITSKTVCFFCQEYLGPCNVLAGKIRSQFILTRLKCHTFEQKVRYPGEIEYKRYVFVVTSSFINKTGHISSGLSCCSGYRSNQRPFYLLLLLASFWRTSYSLLDIFMGYFSSTHPQ